MPWVFAMLAGDSSIDRSSRHALGDWKETRTLFRPPIWSTERHDASEGFASLELVDTEATRSPRKVEERRTGYRARLATAASLRLALEGQISLGPAAVSRASLFR